MNRILIVFVAFLLLSCGDKQINKNEVQVTDTIKSVKSATYDWSWESKGPRNKTVSFEITDHTSGGEETSMAYSLINTSGMIRDIYTYKDGKPDYNPVYRVWVAEYLGNASKLNVEWSGTLIQHGGGGTSNVEILFQVYGEWPAYAMNMRPQIDEEITPSNIDKWEEAEKRLIARYYDKSINLSDSIPIPISANGEYQLQDGITYRMQLFTRIVNNEGNNKAHYEIKDGFLKIEYEEIE